MCGIGFYYNCLLHFVSKRLCPLFWKRRRWLARTQWLFRDDLNSIQLQLLVKLLRHCYETVPYYRDLMDREGIHVSDVCSLKDIEAFPILSKEEVARNERALVSTKYPWLLVRKTQTGGTTGKPLNLYRDVCSIANEHAFVRRQFEWAGIGLRDRGAILLAQRVIDPSQCPDRLWCYNPFMKEVLFSSHHLNLDTGKQYLRIMEKYGVTYMYVFPSVLNVLCQVKAESSVNLKVRSIMTTAETLSNSLKQRAEEVFGCPVFDNYGSSERVCYICSCEKGNYHLVPEYGYAEFVPIDGHANRFHLVATGFWNYAMPLIRYDTGDIVALSSSTCSCGREFTTVESINGREGDIVKTASGREYGPAILTYLVRGTNHVLESQIVQDALDHVTIKYVPTEGFGQRDLESFRKSIRQHLPQELSWSLQRVAMIERTAGGKLRPVVSLLSGQP